MLCMRPMTARALAFAAVDFATLGRREGKTGHERPGSPRDRMLGVSKLASERVDWRLGPPVAADGVGTAQWQPGELQDGLEQTGGVRSVHLRVVGRGGDFVFLRSAWRALNYQASPPTDLVITL